jgi:limonene-1,2-epoxide hydrolase
VRSATHSRGLAQAWHRCRPDDRSKIHGKEKAATVARLKTDTVASIDLSVVPTRAPGAQVLQIRVIRRAPKLSQEEFAVSFQIPLLGSQGGKSSMSRHAAISA